MRWGDTASKEHLHWSQKLQGVWDMQEFGLRRAVDIVVSALVMVLLSPVFVMITLAILLDTGGPVLVAEPRVGRRLRQRKDNPRNRLFIFRMYRFRTAYAQHTNVARMIDSDRITRVGRFLQRTSLDEFPQLINVLRGEMTLIGPRPVVPEALPAEQDRKYEERFSVKPGVIGLWQVVRGHIGTLQEMFEIDVLYVRNRSLKMDLRILRMSFGALIRRGTVQHWVHESVLRVRENPYYSLFKRLMDIFLALNALIVLAPVLLLISTLIRLDSPGPVFFVQARAGKRVLTFSDRGPVLLTTSFKIYKFRTMYHNPRQNDAVHKQWVQDWVSGRLNPEAKADEVVKPTRDPRITRVGAFLRATSMDELPQLLNVLRGDMSLVGPRPVPVYEVEAYEEDQHTRLDAVPGITGWWQIHLRGRGTLDQMVELDLEYLHKRSLWMDIKILFLTIPAVITGRGAK